MIRWVLYNEPNQGLHSTQCSFGHDEYLYRMLRHNDIKLPEEAYYDSVSFIISLAR